MIRNILVPTDFSDCALNAVQYAVRLKADINAENLFIMHAYSIPISYSDVGISSAEMLVAQQQKEIKESFEVLENQLSELKEPGIKMITRQQLAVDSILSFCEEENIDLIIMGTKGASGLEEIIFGTITNTLIKVAPVPVLAIPEMARYHRPQHLALASDYKELNTRQLEPLKLLNSIYGLDINIIHIDSEKKLGFGETEEAKKLERYFKNIPHRYHFIVATAVGETIQDFIRNNHIDLLAVIPRKHTFFERIFKKSESSKLIFHTTIPLLALPETKN